MSCWCYVSIFTHVFGRVPPSSGFDVTLMNSEGCKCKHMSDTPQEDCVFDEQYAAWTHARNADKRREKRNKEKREQSQEQTGG